MTPYRVETPLVSLRRMAPHVRDLAARALDVPRENVRVSPTLAETPDGAWAPTLSITVDGLFRDPAASSRYLESVLAHAHSLITAWGDALPEQPEARERGAMRGGTIGPMQAGSP